VPAIAFIRANRRAFTEIPTNQHNINIFKKSPKTPRSAPLPQVRGFFSHVKMNPSKCSTGTVTPMHAAEAAPPDLP
jgi:hypothetical protein